MKANLVPDGGKAFLQGDSGEWQLAPMREGEGMGANRPPDK